MCGTACCSSSQQCVNNACVDSTGTGGTSGTAGTTGSAGSGGGSGGATGTAGRGGTTGTAGRGGTTGTAGTVGTGGATAGTTGTGGSATGMTLVTSAPNAYWNTTGTLTTSTGTATVTVNDTSTKQTWDGFGGAFNEAGWSQLMKLSQADRDKAMQLLFGTDGAHFGWGRIPIGASDYALTRYTEDETSGDTALSNFSISRDMMYLIPYINAAKDVNPNVKFWASPWTPPTWMKTFSGSVNGTSCATMGGNNFNGGCFNATSANMTALASYFVKWIQAYKAQGITIDTLAAQNEPNYSQGYPSCLWNPADYAKFLSANLGPAFSSAGLSTRIMLGTMSNGDNGASSKDLMVVQAVEADATAKGLVKMMGLQWGMLDLYEGLVSGVGPSNFMTGSLPVWATEHKCGNYPWNPTGTNTGTGQPFKAYVEPAPNDQAYGFESWAYIRNAITKGGVTAYNAWNMVLDSSGKGNDTVRQWSQDSLLVVNSSNQLVQTPAFHVFRHASQYTQIGAQVVTTTGGDAFAFKNPNGSVVAVMYNSGSTANYVVQIKGQKYGFSMPGTGWATVVIP
jgi:glucosylceramidase